MDLESYWGSLCPAGKSAFADRANSSVMYVGHVVRGAKKASSIEFLLRLAEASQGAITVEELRPDLFGRNQAGRRRARMLRNDVSINSTAAAKTPEVPA